MSETPQGPGDNAETPTNNQRARKGSGVDAIAGPAKGRVDPVDLTSEIQNSFLDYATVSYTHLDVYKRQKQTS